MRSQRKVILSILAVLSLNSQQAIAQDELPTDSSFVNGTVTYHVPPRYRPSEEHPLRVLAYLVHPIGWAAREFVFRPLSDFAASTPVTRSVMGFKEISDYRTTVCFGPGTIPDCKKLAPYSMISRDLGNSKDGDVVLSGDQIFFPDVNFDFDKSTLTPVGKGRVRQAALMLSSMPDIKVVVEGHTDYIGSDDYNLSLGQKRAETVRSELADLGIDPERLTVVSYGESQPVFTEETDWARAVNRRAHFVKNTGQELPSPVVVNNSSATTRTEQTKTTQVIKTPNAPVVPKAEQATDAAVINRNLGDAGTPSELPPASDK